MMTSTTDRYSITGKSILGLARSYLECFSHCTCNNSMQYSPSDAESRAIFPPLPPIFNGILSWEAQPRVTKYRWISGNITRGEAECNISRYWMRESSRMKYPTHPEGRLRPLAAPARGMCWIFHEGWFPNPISQGNGGNIARFSASRGVYCLYSWLEVIFETRNKLIIKLHFW